MVTVYYPEWVMEQYNPDGESVDLWTTHLDEPWVTITLKFVEKTGCWRMLARSLNTALDYDLHGPHASPEGLTEAEARRWAIERINASKRTLGLPLTEIRGA
ncbi:hypothetical protein [Nonomuraea zeae]|uniref:hypothetical protein n=1 Tax=Nonomuraea zeae TaxID=1642303 RepID=UPI00360E2D1F